MSTTESCSASVTPREDRSAGARTLLRVDALDLDYLEDKICKYFEPDRLSYLTTNHLPASAETVLEGIRAFSALSATREFDIRKASLHKPLAGVDLVTCGVQGTTRLNVFVVDTIQNSLNTWGDLFMSKRTIYARRPKASKYLATPNFDWSFADDLWVSIHDQSAVSSSQWWAVTTDNCQLWILGLFSSDRRHIMLIPSVFAINAAPPLAYWMDASACTMDRSPHLIQHPLDAVSLPNPDDFPPSNVPDDVDDIDNDPGYEMVDINPAPVPEPLPSRISRILEKSQTESVALGTRAKTLARKGFIARNEQTGEAQFVPLSDAHLKAMRMKSIFIKPGNALSWNDGTGRSKTRSSDVDLDSMEDDTSLEQSEWSRENSFGPKPAELLEEKESWAYKSRQASAIHCQPTRESSAVWGPGIAVSDVSSAYQKRWNRVFDWQQEHFGTDDELGGKRAPFPGLPDIVL